MKAKYKTFALMLALAILASCQSKISFTKTKPETNKGFTEVESVASYHARFNPKANGIVVISMGNGAEYTADKLNAAQLASLLTLLQDKSLQFDTKNEEFILNK